MTDKINTVHHKNFLDNTLPDKCANLIIADPPYYKVKGDFDFIWKTFDDYLADVEKWAIECKRVLADNGTLLWYGDAKNIAYSQIIFDKYFNLLNNITWENTNDHKQQIRFNEDLRSFAPLGERILMYDNGEDKSGNDRIFADQKLFRPIKQYFDNWIDESGITLKEAVKEIGSTCTHWFGFTKREKTQFSFPTVEKWNRMDEILKHKQSYEELRESYEELRESYEELRRPFNNALHLGDVIRLPNLETSNYDHDTIKPEKLTSILIDTCSRKGDTVVVPFAGSGTECAMSAKYKRQFYAYEIEEKHVNTATKRVKPHLMQQTLF